MEKSELIDSVASKLMERGLGDSAISEYTQRLSEMIDGLSDEERKAILSGRISADKIASELTGDDGGEKAPDVPDEKKTEVREWKEPLRKRPEQAVRQAGGSEKRPSEKAHVEPKNRDVRQMRKKTDNTKYYVLMGSVSPFLALLMAVVLALLAVVVCLLVLLIPVLVVLLIAIAAVAAVISLVGVIYGVFQLFTASAAVGYYEIGIGLIAAGCASFVCILLYNAAIRFNPWLLRKLFALTGNVHTRLKAAFAQLKEAMAK